MLLQDTEIVFTFWIKPKKVENTFVYFCLFYFSFSSTSVSSTSTTYVTHLEIAAGIVSKYYIKFTLDIEIYCRLYLFISGRSLRKDIHRKITLIRHRDRKLNHASRQLLRLALGLCLENSIRGVHFKDQLRIFSKHHPN